MVIAFGFAFFLFIQTMRVTVNNNFNQNYCNCVKSYRYDSLFLLTDICHSEESRNVSENPSNALTVRLGEFGRDPVFVSKNKNSRILHLSATFSRKEMVRSSDRQKTEIETQSVKTGCESTGGYAKV